MEPPHLLLLLVNFILNFSEKSWKENKPALSPVMFSLILPPFIILLALGGIMYLYFRKLPEVEAQLHYDSGAGASASGASDRVQRFFLGIVEWFARWSKTLSLRLYKLLHGIAQKAHEAKERAGKRVSLGKPSTLFHGKRANSTGQSEEGGSLSTETSESLASQEDALSSLVSSPMPSTPGEMREGDTDTRNQERLAFPDGIRKNQIEAKEQALASPVKTIDPAFSQEWPHEDEEQGQMSRVSSPMPHRPSRTRRIIGDAIERLSPIRTTPPAPFREEVQETSNLPLETTSVKNQLEEILIERISMNPRDIEAYERLGDYYLEQDNLTDAKECYRQVLKLSPAYRLVKIKIRRLERLLEKR